MDEHINRNTNIGSVAGECSTGLIIHTEGIVEHHHACITMDSNYLHTTEDHLPPSYEFILEQTALPVVFNSSERTFRPPPPNQLTIDDAKRMLDYAEYAWEHQNWSKAQTHYSTAAAMFRILEDFRNEAFCLQRLGEICRLLHQFSASRAHILQAHILFGQCGEISRQLMCERWLARTASDEGKQDEAQLLLQSALDKSREAGLYESEGWCLLRLGEVEGTGKNLIQQALDIARDHKLPLLEARCHFAFSAQKKNISTPQPEPLTNAQNANTQVVTEGGKKQEPKIMVAGPSAPSVTQRRDVEPKTSQASSRIGRWFQRSTP